MGKKVGTPWGCGGWGWGWGRSPQAPVGKPAGTAGGAAHHTACGVAGVGGRSPAHPHDGGRPAYIRLPRALGGARGATDKVGSATPPLLSRRAHARPPTTRPPPPAASRRRGRSRRRRCSPGRHTSPSTLSRPPHTTTHTSTLGPLPAAVVCQRPFPPAAGGGGAREGGGPDAPLRTHPPRRRGGGHHPPHPPTHPHPGSVRGAAGERSLTRGGSGRAKGATDGRGAAGGGVGADATDAQRDARHRRCRHRVHPPDSFRRPRRLAIVWYRR